MTTGIMLTTPGGSHFWYPCKDAKTGVREMSTIPYVYGSAWGHPDTVLAWGTSDGVTFTAKEPVVTGWAATESKGS